MQKNSEKQFTKAYDQYARAIFRHVFYRVSSEKIAEDITQEVFFKTWRYVARGNEIDDYKNFLYRTAKNLIIDHYRQKSKETLSLDELEENIGVRPSPKNEFEEFLNKEYLEKALEGLDEEQREMIIYKYIDGLRSKEIAKITGKTVSNINVIIHRGLKILRSRYEKDV